MSDTKEKSEISEVFDGWGRFELLQTTPGITITTGTGGGILAWYKGKQYLTWDALFEALST